MESHGPTIAVVGATGTGLVYKLARLPEEGETLVAEALTVVPGGKASNHAVGLARLGARAILLSALGDDTFAQHNRSVWRDRGIDDAGTVEIPGTYSLVGSVLVDAAGRNRIVVAAGAMDAYTAAHVDAHADLIRRSDLLLVSLEMAAEPALRALQIGRDAGVPTVLNPAPAPLPAQAARLLRYADWVTPNEGEARTLTGFGDPVAAAHRLRELSGGNVVVTLGSAGALLLTADNVVRVPSVQVDHVVDTSGAGDAFNVAFVLALARGLPAETAVRSGCAAGARIIQGPDLFSSLHLLDDLSVTADADQYRADNPNQEAFG